jgi:dihydroorotase-like cyclic amidohydrolase
VDAASTAPARLFRLTGKGDVAVGHDADLVLVDLNQAGTITDEQVLSKIGWTPYAGMTLTGMPVRTLVRGATVFANGCVTGRPGWGRQARAVGRKEVSWQS